MSRNLNVWSVYVHEPTDPPTCLNVAFYKRITWGSVLGLLILDRLLVRLRYTLLAMQWKLYSWLASKDFDLIWLSNLLTMSDDERI